MTPGLLIRKVRLKKKKQLWTGIQTHVHGLPASMQGALGNSCGQIFFFKYKKIFF